MVSQLSTPGESVSDQLAWIGPATEYTQQQRLLAYGPEKFQNKKIAPDAGRRFHFETSVTPAVAPRSFDDLTSASPAQHPTAKNQTNHQHSNADKNEW